jgi:hypothetical protein
MTPGTASLTAAVNTTPLTRVRTAAGRAAVDAARTHPA